MSERTAELNARITDLGVARAALAARREELAGVGRVRRFIRTARRAWLIHSLSREMLRLEREWGEAKGELVTCPNCGAVKVTLTATAEDEDAWAGDCAGCGQYVEWPKGLVL